MKTGETQAARDPRRVVTGAGIDAELAMMPAGVVGEHLARAIIEPPLGDEAVLDDAGRSSAPSAAPARVEAECSAHASQSERRHLSGPSTVKGLLTARAGVARRRWIDFAFA
jgi:hypothetical protein